MRNRSGPPVSGEDFAFRDREVAYAEKMLLDGNSVLLFGLRRLGKTSVPDLHRSFFSQFDECLRRRFAEAERRTAERIMDVLARAGSGRLSVGEIDRVLDGTGVDRGVLMHRLTLQQFLEPVVGSAGYCFAFNLIRRWRLARGA